MKTVNANLRSKILWLTIAIPNSTETCDLSIIVEERVDEPYTPNSKPNTISLSSKDCELSTIVEETAVQIEVTVCLEKQANKHRMLYQLNHSQVHMEFWKRIA